MPAIPLVAAAAGAYSAIKGADQARKSANQANDAAKAAKVDVNSVSRAAEDQALRNIERSRAIEQQYAPENAALRQNSVQALLGQLGQSPVSTQLQALLSSQLGRGIGAASYDAQTANSDLLNAAIARAQENLALGGSVPLDVRNLVARTAAARTGQNFGNLGLARDVTARDLGLTSLDLANQRLAQAQALGQAQLAANQFNAGQQNQAGQFNANILQNSRQFDATNLLNQAQLLQALSNGDYAKALSAAQFGQSIAPPVVGLDPSAVANLYVGNQNVGTQAGLQAAQIGAAQAQGASQLGGSLFGAGLGGLANYYGSKTASNPGAGAKTTYYDYLAANPYSSAAVGQN